MIPVALQTAAFSPTHTQQRRISVKTWVGEHIVALNVLSLAIVGLLVVSYIFQVNATISQGYQIRELETTLEELTLLNQTMELDARRSQSLEHVAESVKMLGFVEAEMPTYISGNAPAFALAE